MRICVIFNPVARGERAKQFRSHLDAIGAECTLKQTQAAGGARPLAAEAIREGFDTIVAAGGDGTLNETLNGMGDVPGGFEKARLAVLPLGTVNVFAKELAMPSDWQKGWEIIRKGREIQIDLPMVEFSTTAETERRYFAQLAGTGLDARAIELANWELKKKLGAWAYIWAGIKAMSEKPASVTFSDDKAGATGALVLIGNGQFYGGKYRLHPTAELHDGFLHVCVFPKVNALMLARCAGFFLAGRPLPKGMAKAFKSNKFTLSSPSPAPFEVDGENIGHLPATFSIAPEKLRVIAP